MPTRDHIGIVVVDIPADCSLLEAAALPTIERIESLLGISARDKESEAPAKSSSSVLLTQSSPCHDNTPTWRREVSETLLRGALIRRLKRLDAIVEAIGRSQARWCWASAHDCSGSWATFAGACHERWWFNTEARLDLGDEILATRVEDHERSGWIHLTANANNWIDVARSMASHTRKTPSGRPSPARPNNQRPFTARFSDILANSYAAALECTEQESSITRIQAAGGGRRPPLWIDMNELAPPSSAIASLLESGRDLVLASADGQRLRESTKLLFDRLSGDVSRARLDDLWRQRIHWLAVDPDTVNGTVLSWTFDDRMYLRSGTRSVCYHRLSGNVAAAPLGWCEWHGAPSTDPKDDFENIAGCLMRGRVSTRPIGPKQVPLSMFARSRFLSLLLDLARRGEISMNALSAQLDAHGWGFAGKSASWERFLRMRESAYDSDSAPLSVTDITISQSDWDVVSWRDAIGIVKHESLETDAPWPIEHMVRMLAARLWQVAGALVAAGHMGSLDEADLLCRESLGFPITWGTLRGYAQREGTTRLDGWMRWRGHDARKTQ